jgi:hypothetical protein
MDWNWWYFVLGVASWPFLKLLALAINRVVIEHRQKRFLKLVSVTFPDKETTTFIALDTSDKRSMAKLERQIREQFDIPDGEDKNRDLDRSLRLDSREKHGM